MGKKILVISPTPTHPQNAGNRTRIYFLLKVLKRLGNKIHLLYEDRERKYIHVQEGPNIKAMKKEWDKFYYVINEESYLDKRFKKMYDLNNKFMGKIGILVKRINKKYYKNLKFYFPDKHSINIWKPLNANFSSNLNDKFFNNIDDWYNPKITKLVKRLQKKHNYDVVIVEYVYLSKALNFFPKDVLKIIDTHDVFSNRKENLNNKGLYQNYFTTIVSEERKGLNRANKIIAIQNEEKAFFENIVNKNVEVLDIGHILTIKRPKKKRISKNILFLGSANKLNLYGIENFIKNIYPLIKEKLPDSKLIFAGGICKTISKDFNLENHEDYVLLGEIPNVEKAYDLADVVINPCVFGTGLKIKNIEAMGFGKPLVTTSYGAEGFIKEKNKSFILADKDKDFADSVIKILTNEKLYNNLSENALRFIQRYNEDCLFKIKKLFD